jgi:hypothetical protein
MYNEYGTSITVFTDGGIERTKIYLKEQQIFGLEIRFELLLAAVIVCFSY